MQKSDFRNKLQEEIYVDLLSDAGFKAVFGDESNKGLVIMFINRILNGERVVKDIAFRNNELFKQGPSGKGVRLDLHCVDENGARFVIEMQKARHDEDFYYRSIYYCSRAFTLQRSEGDHDYYCQPVYLIGIMQGHLQHECYNPLKSCISRYGMINDSPDIIAPATISCIFVQLGYFRKCEEDCIDLLDQWCYCLKHAKQMHSLPENFSNDEIDALRKASEISNFEEEKQQLYKDEIMTQLDINHESYFTGKDDAKAETAKNLLSCGIDIQTIAKCTGLSIEAIQALGE